MIKKYALILGFLSLVPALSLTTQAQASVESSTHTVEDSYSREFGVTAGLNLLSGYALEFHYRPLGLLSFSTNIGGLRTTIEEKSLSSYDENGYSRYNSSKTKLGLFEVDGRVKLHPFSGAFYLGTALGYHSISVQTNDSFTNEATYQALFVAPHLGWLWVLDSGLAMGFEFGPSFSITSSIKESNLYRTKRTSNPTSYALPLVSLFKIGYMF